MLRPGHLDRQRDPGDAAEQFAVARGVRTALRVPPLEQRELDREHRGLQRVEAAVVAEQFVVVAHLGAVTAQHVHFFGERVVVGQDHAAVPDRAEVLRREERKGPGVADAADQPAHPARTGGLGAVLDHLELVALRDLADRRHVAREPVEVHRDDRARALGDPRLDLRRVEVEGRLVDVDEDRPRPRVLDDLGRRDEGERRRDDLVPGAHARPEQPEQQGVGPGGHADRVAHAVQLRHLLLEAGERRAEDVLGPAQHLGEHPLQLGLDRAVLARQVDERDHRLVSPFTLISRPPARCDFSAASSTRRTVTAFLPARPRLAAAADALEKLPALGRERLAGFDLDRARALVQVLEDR